MSRFTWLGAGALAALVHIAVLAAVFQPTSEREGYAEDLGERGLEVGLGKVGSYQDALEQARKAARPKTIATEPVVTPPMPSMPEAKLNIHKPRKPKTAPPPERKPPLPMEAPPPPKKETVEDNPSEEKVDVPKADRTDQHDKHNQRAMQAATGKSDRLKAGGKSGSAADYFAQLQQWLNRYKEYPAALKKQKQQGVVTVKFTIDRSGRLLSSSIKKTSGHPGLDQAALAMLANASPLPPVPDSIHRDRLTIALPVEYSLITD